MLPARAGMSPGAKSPANTRARAPRTGGDEPARGGQGPMLRGVLPARAGMSPLYQGQLLCDFRAPRTGGDEPGPEQDFDGLHTCSPHGRG